MPTFNQLVRKGRTVAEVKSTAPALQKGYNAKKKTTIRSVAFALLSELPHRRSRTLR